MIPFNNCEEYLIHKQKFLNRIKTKELLTLEEIDSLNPDKIDNSAFWKETVDKFGGYTYCGMAQCNNKVNVDDVNFRNKILHFQMGSTNPLDLAMIWSPKSYYNIMEIGYGLGSLYQIIEDCYDNMNRDYFGIDVYHHPLSKVPKEKTFQYDGKDFTCLPKRNDFTHVFCLNVLQHCSIRQKINIINYASEILVERGRLTLSTMISDNGIVNAADGKCYIDHFSQTTPLIKLRELIDMAQYCGFDVFSTCCRSQDGFTNIVLIKKGDSI